MKTITLKAGTSVQSEHLLPEGWKDIEETKRLKVLKYALHLPYPHNFAKICMDYIGIKPAQLSKIPAAQQYDLYDSLKWITAEPTTLPIFKSFRFEGVDYAFPSDKLFNASANEYVIADEYYQKYIETQDTYQLQLLLATLVREIDKDKPTAERLEDPRIPFMYREEAEDRAQRLAGLEPAYQYAAFLQFTGSKKWIHDTYGRYIFSETEENADPDPFGWWGVFFKLAETGVFGNLESTLQTSFHTICQYLMKNAMDAEREKKKKNNKTGMAL